MSPRGPGRTPHDESQTKARRNLHEQVQIASRTYSAREVSGPPAGVLVEIHVQQSLCQMNESFGIGE